MYAINHMHAIEMRRTLIGFARVSFMLLFAAFASVSNAPAQVVAVSITVAPPELPVYDQPPIPAPGYIWTPGYWAWDDGDYYWVPGTWIEPPEVGLLWTPGYWAYNDDGIYAWNAGYWGPHVGFYGGCNYGFGYVGVGYEGGFWRGGVFSYNRTVNNFGGVHITNIYSKTVVVNNFSRTSFNGGAGGLTSKPNQGELRAATEHHVGATSSQTQHQHSASTNKDLRFSSNRGNPKIAATSNVGHFSGAGVMSARDSKLSTGTQNASTGQKGTASSGQKGTTSGGTQGTASGGQKGTTSGGTQGTASSGQKGTHLDKLTTTSPNQGPGAHSSSSGGSGQHFNASNQRHTGTVTLGSPSGPPAHSNPPPPPKMMAVSRPAPRAPPPPPSGGGKKPPQQQHH